MPSLHEKYCIIKTVKHAFSDKVDIKIDFGQDNNFSKDAEIVENFTSVVDAFNYMSGQGWELVNSISSATVLELHYIMRKRFTE